MAWCSCSGTTPCPRPIRRNPPSQRYQCGSSSQRYDGSFNGSSADSLGLDAEFLVVDSRDAARLRHGQRLAVLRDLLRIDGDTPVAIVGSFDRVRIDQLVRDLAHIAAGGGVRLSVERDRMDFAARRLVLLPNGRPRADETASGRRDVDDHLALLRIVHRPGQVDFPDAEKRLALFVLRDETRARPERHHQHDQRLPGHRILLSHDTAWGDSAHGRALAARPLAVTLRMDLVALRLPSEETR